MKIMLDNTEFHFSDYIEIIAINDDSIIFNLYYSKNTGFCLITEEEIDMYNETNYKKIKELAILDNEIKIVDINGNEEYLSLRIKEVIVNNNKGRITSDLLKYNKEIAEKYNLDKEYAYDNVKVKKRQK